MKRLVTVLVVASALMSCRARPTVPTSECSASPSGEVAMTCEMPEWEGRPYNPDGQPYLTEGIVGSVSRHFGNEVILDFFAAPGAR